MIRVQIRVDADVIDAIRQAGQNAPQRMSRAYSRAISRLRGLILNDLRLQPGPPSYPIRWKSERQRRAFFASNGFGRGIPTERSGALVEAYDVEVLTQGSEGLLQITNDVPYAPYVVGDDAQSFHLDTGWQQVADVVVRWEPQASEVLFDTWAAVVDGRD